MCRSSFLCLSGLLLSLSSSYGQSFMSGPNPFSSESRSVQHLTAPEVYSLCLDNQLKEMKLRYEKGVAIAQGRANVKIARLEEAHRVAEVRFQHLQLRQQLADSRRQVLLDRNEQQLRLAQVDVDISRRLHWPEALRRDSLAATRRELERALGDGRRYLSGGAELDDEEVRRVAEQMFAAVRPLRDELGDRRLIEAKHYLEGLVRAAESAVDQIRPADLAVAD